MQVIFLKSIPKVAKVGEIKDVSTGYARNFLFPQKFAVPATQQNIESLKNKDNAQNERQTKMFAKIKRLVSKIQYKKFEIKASSNEEGTLFASIHPKDISNRLKQKKYNIDSKFISLENPIKKVGEYNVPLRVGEKSVGSINILVVKDQQ